MKRFLLLFVFLALAAAVLELSGQDGLLPGDPAPCGLTANVVLDVDPVNHQLTVMASGEEGCYCSWCGLQVTVSMRDAETGLWAIFPIERSQETSLDLGYPYSGFDRAHVTVKALDIPDPIPPGGWACEHEPSGVLTHVATATADAVF